MPRRERALAQPVRRIFDSLVSRLFLLVYLLLPEGHFVVTYLQDSLVSQGAKVRVMKVVTSREFNQDVSQAKRAARIEPVFITDRGRPTHVLMSVETYRRLSGQSETIVDLLAMPAPSPALDLTPERWDR